MISESKKNSLTARMHKLGIFEKDLEEQFIRSSGSGGQKVNKTSSCVWLKHPPSGLEVKCQKTRSQTDNRYFARVLLAEKLEKRVLGKKSAAERKRYKIRKQKQKRSKRAKAKMLEAKKRRATQKHLRKRPRFDD